jgi:hypothetical protein
MQQALRPYAAAGIAILGTGSLMALTPVAPALPDVHVPAIQLTSDSGLLGDFSSLFGDVTGGTSGIGGLGDLAGNLTGLMGGVNPSSLLSDLPGLASVDAAPATSSLLTPYIDLFTTSFTLQSHWHRICQCHAAGAGACPAGDHRQPQPDRGTPRSRVQRADQPGQHHHLNE